MSASAAAPPLTLPRNLPMLIAAMSMMGPFSVDAYLPSFQEIASSLHASSAEVQQTLTAFLVPYAFMSLWHGALSDAWGRKPVVIAALSVLALASVGCALAPTIQLLWAFRVVQGLAAGVFVIGRAVVRDCYSGAQAQRVISQVAVLFGIAPAIAPVLGGQLHEYFGWRSVFVFLAVFSSGIALWVARSLPETHPPALRHPLHPARLASSYLAALRHPGFLSSASASALCFSALFLYVAGAPVYLPRDLHIRETEFAWLFIPITTGLMLGGFLSGKLAGRLDAAHTLAWSTAVMILAAAGNIALHALHTPALPWSMVPIFVYGAGVATAMPTLTLIGLDYFPHQRGLASSCQAFLLTAANAAVSGLLIDWASSSLLRLTVVSAALMLLGLTLMPFVRRGAPATIMPAADPA